MRHLITHSLDRSADTFPEKVVFRFEEVTLTYAECVARTNQLANALLESGVQRGDRVGIYLHKSMESAVAVYGIMKAGAAYVPIDPRLPPTTVNYLIRQTGIRHLVTESAKLKTLIDSDAVACLDVIVGPPDDGILPSTRVIGWDQVAASPILLGSRAPRTLEADLAYIMFTSGSTGVPKGIMHTHRSGLSYAEMAARLYGIRPDDLLSNHSHLHFDMSVFDLVSGPLSGATTVIIPEPYMLLPASLSELIQDERLTIFYSVSSALVDLVLRGDLDNRDLSSLRWVNFAGEFLPPVYLQRLMRALPQARFSNVYGPAETNQCTYFHVPPLPNDYSERFVPIGSVWEIADAIVVDGEDRPVGPGEQGELLVASSTRMSGYWQDPERTRAVFFQDHSVGATAVERVYLRTGDLVRVNEAGLYELLGRKDRQVKHRGFRIELDGIEATLVEHEGVAEAAVWLSECEPREIEAAVTACREAELAEDDLRRHVGDRLPPYAVPSRIAVVESFSYTGSGKIDRLAVQKGLEGQTNSREEATR